MELSQKIMFLLVHAFLLFYFLNLILKTVTF